MHRVVVALLVGVLVISGLPVPTSVAAPQTGITIPAPATTAQAERSGPLTPVEQSPPSCSLRSDDDNSSGDGGGGDGDNEPPADVETKPWFQRAHFYSQPIGGPSNAETWFGLLHVQRGALDSPLVLELVIVNRVGATLAEKAVTVTPTEDPSTTVISLLHTTRGGRRPSYLEFRVNGQVVATHSENRFGEREAVVDTSFNASEQAEGGITATASFTVDRDDLDSRITPTIRIRDGEGHTVASRSFEILSTDGAGDDESLVTKTVDIRAFDTNRLYYTVNWELVDYWRDPTPYSDPVRKDPPGRPIPEIGTLNWSTTTNGVSPTTIAYLFSRDDEGSYLNQSEFYDEYGKNRTAMMQMAMGSDRPLTQPSSSAQTWTRNDFSDLNAGRSGTSVVPTGAETTDGTYIKDAHATVFAAQPSTVLHRSNGTTVQYVAPEGQVLGLIDYRTAAPENRIPEDPDPNDTRELFCVASSDIEIRFLQDGRVTNRTADQTPRFNYSLPDDGSIEHTLSIETTIDAEIASRTDEYVCKDEAGNGSDDAVGSGFGDESRSDSSGDVVDDPGDEDGNESDDDTGEGSEESKCFWAPGEVENSTESLTVSETLEVSVYRLSATATNTTYPNGDEGLAVYYSGPWSSVSLTTDESSDVRGVWRYYTAHRPEWGVLAKHRTDGDDEYVNSPALPVQVHAYPSRVGPMADHAGITILKTWGQERQSPAGFGNHVEIKAVQPSYTSSWGMAVRAPAVDQRNVTVQGIVAGMNASPTPATTGAEEPIRDSNLTLEIVSTSEQQAVVEVRLRDNETGQPIPLRVPPRDNPFRPGGGNPRDGYVVVNGKRVKTDATGTARVTITEPGQINARYVPEGWVSVDPAYTSDSATVRWLPQTTIWYWVDLAVQILKFALPFLVVWYGGRKFGELFAYERT